MTIQRPDSARVLGVSAEVQELGCANGQVESGSGLMCPPPASVKVEAPTQSRQGAI